MGDVPRFSARQSAKYIFTQPCRENTASARSTVKEKYVGKATKEGLSRSKRGLAYKTSVGFLWSSSGDNSSADASCFGLGAVLLQKQLNDELRPIAYMSRAMTPTEKRYAQIEKEALALTWAYERFSGYLFGLQFHLQTDHKPLVSFFSKKNLDELPIWVQRFRLRLMQYSFTISHVAGKDLAIADALSRAPFSEPTADDLRLQNKQVHL